MVGTTIDSAQTARVHMVDSQVRPNGVTSAALVDALLSVAREKFVGPEHRSLAYMEGRLRLTAGRYLTEPMIFAKLAQFAEIEPDHSVLLIGAGVGYGAAVLAKLSKSVTAVESDGALADRARSNLADAGALNVTVAVGPLTAGAPGSAPFDRIIIDGAVEAVPQGLLDQLADGGKLLAIVLDDGLARGVAYTRSGVAFGHRAVFDGRTAMLPGFEKPRGFVF